MLKKDIKAKAKKIIITNLILSKIDAFLFEQELKKRKR